MKHTRVLRFVNRIRRELGAEPLKEMPKGRRDRLRSCPVARAMPGNASVCGEVEVRAPGAAAWRVFPLDPYVDAWIDRFDAGKYPDLIEAS